MFSKAVLLFLVVYFSLGSANELKTEKFFREDYTYIEAVESFYKIHTTPRKWAEAKGTCALEGATLWHPDNDDEAREVKTFWKNTQPGIDWVYVGLSDIMVEGVFETVDGKSVTQVYNKWEPGQPGNNGDCGYLYKEGNLGDWTCDSVYYFICKKTLRSLERNYRSNASDLVLQTDVRPDKFFRNDYSYIETEKSFYKLHTSAQTWAEAERACVQEGAILWHPDNDDEMHAVISFWNTTLPAVVYVGMSDLMAKGQFETVEGKLVSDVYNKWEPGQPNNYGGTQHCIRFYKSENVLDDCSCENTYDFICKKSLQSLKWNNYCNVSDSDYTLNKGNGKCYKIHTTPLSWVEAYAICRREQSHLAVISGQSANHLLDYLVNLTESKPKPRVKENYQRGIYHVGFHNRFKEGWQTVKGTPMNVDAQNWLDGYIPADDRDQCGSMFYTGRLINTDCDMKSFFICEHELSSASTEILQY